MNITTDIESTISQMFTKSRQDEYKVTFITWRIPWFILIHVQAQTYSSR